MGQHTEQPLDVLESLAAWCNEKNIGKAEYGRRSAVYAAVAEMIDKVDSALTLGWSDTAARELRAALAAVQGAGK